MSTHTDNFAVIEDNYLIRASSTELILWAIMNFVVSFKDVRNAFRICASVAVSTALVLSSRIRILWLFEKRPGDGISASVLPKH